MILSTILLAATCTAAPTKYASVSLRPIQTLQIGGSIATRMGLASDVRYDYLATPAGLFRAPSLLSSTAQLIPEIGDKVNGVAVNEGAVYAMRQAVEVKGDRAVDHSLVRSTNHGDTFVPIDAGIEDCFAGYCVFLPATEISFAPGRIFLGAGGNVLVSSDDAATWKILHGATQDGKPALQSCPAVFHRIGQTVLVGGECPLDVGFVRAGELKPDLLEWSVPPASVGTPEMENRNVQFITTASGATYAGIEGALMKSCDSGATFKNVIHFPLSGTPQYPYIHQFLAPSSYPGVLLAGGFDKAQSGPYLAWSADGGETWSDISSLIPRGTVSLLGEGRDRRPLLVVQEDERAIVMEIVVKKRDAHKWAPK